MKVFKCVLFVMILVSSVSFAYALEGVQATDDEITLLKTDVVAGKIKVGKTRLKEIRKRYGEASTINDAARKLVYDYGDLKLEFDKVKYFRSWKYDYSKEAAYSDDVEDLRDDLESQQIVGNFITLREIKKSYDEPTEVDETFEDGQLSLYYYGQIQLTFENVIVVRSWKGENLGEAKEQGVLSSSE